ncbi:uncharacterized protein LOC131937515 isoform X2 [Physella acuta]|nr:uncharacterized protein LOC131937515 isoform X2 [Physella acuta]
MLPHVFVWLCFGAVFEVGAQIDDWVPAARSAAFNPKLVGAQIDDWVPAARSAAFNPKLVGGYIHDWVPAARSAAFNPKLVGGYIHDWVPAARSAAFNPKLVGAQIDDWVPAARSVAFNPILTYSTPTITYPKRASARSAALHNHLASARSAALNNHLASDPSAALRYSLYSPPPSITIPEPELPPWWNFIPKRASARSAAPHNHLSKLFIPHEEILKAFHPALSSPGPIHAHAGQLRDVLRGAMPVSILPMQHPHPRHFEDSSEEDLSHENFNKHNPLKLLRRFFAPLSLPGHLHASSEEDAGPINLRKYNAFKPMVKYHDSKRYFGRRSPFYLKPSDKLFTWP